MIFKQALTVWFEINSLQKFVSLSKDLNGFIEEMPSAGENLNDKELVEDLFRYDGLYLFYSKSIGPVLSLLEKQNIIQMPLYQLPMLNLKFESKPTNKPIPKKSCHGVKITQSFIDRLKG